MPGAPDLNQRREQTLTSAYLALASDWRLWQMPLVEALRQVTRRVAEAVDVRRASVWWIEPDERRMRCLALHDTTGGDDAGGVILEADAPDYFAAVRAGRVIDAHDAIHDARTRDLGAHYLARFGIQAMMDATLRVEGETRGAFSIEHVGGLRLWNDAERRFIVSIADLVSQLLVRDRTRASEQETVLHIAQGIAAATGERFFDTLCSELSQALGVDVVYVGELTADGASVETISVHAHGQRIDNFSYSTAGTPCAVALRTGMCMYPEGVHRQFPDDRYLVEMGAEGYLGAQLVASTGEVLGLLVAVHAAPIADPKFGEMLLRIFAVRAASELERRSQERDLQRSRAELVARNEVLRLVARLSSRLHRLLDAEAIVRETVDALDGFAHPALTCCYLLASSGDYLQLVASAGLDEAAQIRTSRLPATGSLSGQALRNDRMEVCDDIPHQPGMNADARAVLLDRGIVQLIILPLTYRNRSLGTITLGFRERAAFSGEKRGTFEAIAQAVSLALANAKHVADLEHQAHHDGLTGLPNRVRLHLEFDRTRSATIGRATTRALLLLDLNRFKEINDTLGHHAGDRLLEQVGPRLRSALVGVPALVSRLGGDEFSVLLHAVADEAEALGIAGRIATAFRQPFLVDGLRLEVGASIGVAVAPQHGEDSHQLLRCADVAMYEAKRSGTGVKVYDQAFDQHTPERLGLVHDLGDAIRSDQLQLFLQPKLDLRSGAIQGFEGLVRWQHPQLGLLPPAAFLPLAEVGDIIHDLTYRVIELALMQLRQWQIAGLDQYAIAVNLSPRNLLQRDFATRFEALLKAHGTDPTRLELELTETAIVQDPEGATECLNRITALGVRVAIDDFGTGYSSLARLRRLPIRSLKIDRSFVGDMVEDPADATIVQSVIGLAHNLGLEVVAEGVENEATLAMLRGMGCDFIQGYYLSRPLPWREIEQWLAARTPG
ncbi:MAG: EAL domain-containing protein [Burkholderiales bacterium]|nr:EAL domain-containing protein [Burkholderiales bacterium]